MDTVWGSVAQYSELYWGWPIAVYLFLAGLSAGAVMTALLVKWIEGNETQPWDGLIKAGALLAPPTIILGLGLLIVDLSRPMAFYQLMLHYQLRSVMSIGVVLLILYTPLSLLFAGSIFKKALSSHSFSSLWFRPLLPVVNLFEKTRSMEGILFAFAVGVAIYTGFLLSALVAKPLLNVAVLPLLFLVSGLSAGIAANILLGLTVFRSTVAKENLKFLLTLDLRVIPFELLTLFLLFTGLYFHGGTYAAIAGAALTAGIWAKVFWIGVVGIGLALPVIIAVTSLHGHVYKLQMVLLNSALALVGVLLLRLYILYAGQIFS
ncbi:MAG: psrC [Firmicutes bacterium]|nr:psrC [Bacillota bacterium]